MLHITLFCACLVWKFYSGWCYDRSKRNNVSSGDCYYFDVSEEGRLWQTHVESSIWQTVVQHPVRVIGKFGKKWILDPSPSDSMLFCQLWF